MTRVFWGPRNSTRRRAWACELELALTGIASWNDTPWSRHGARPSSEVALLGFKEGIHKLESVRRLLRMDGASTCVV